MEEMHIKEHVYTFNDIELIHKLKLQGNIIKSIFSDGGITIITTTEKSTTN